MDAKRIPLRLVAVGLLASTLFSSPSAPTSPPNYQYYNVFGVHCAATNSVPRAKFLHMVQVLAQYLDNDEDLVPDDPRVIQAMKGNLGGKPALMLLFQNEAEANSVFQQHWSTLRNYRFQELFAFECKPGGSSQHGGFDATLEEVLHLVTDTGYARAYPSVFGTSVDTELCDAMDVARGGRFLNVPNNYPPSAWYHYDDQSCDYGCQATEYFYWLLTSILGAQDYPRRCNDIAIEWEPCTPAAVQATDTLGWALMHDPRFQLPTVLPDGTYR